MVFLLTLMTIAGTDIHPSDTTSLKGNGDKCSHLGNTDLIYEIVEYMPDFPGGSVAMNQFLSENLRYPAMALENKIEGVVVLEFVVTHVGKICNPRI